MNETKKLNEAQYFFERMFDARQQPEFFRYELSAFLGTCRAIIEYASEELSSRAGGKAWYKGWVNTSRTFRFLSEQKNINIHHEPVPSGAQVTIAFDEPIPLNPKKTAILVSEKDKVQAQAITASSAGSKWANDSESNWRHEFSGWTGEEDVIALCREYLMDLKRFVSEGVARGFISG